MTSLRRCPKCNEPNSPDAIQCIACHAPLTHACPNCGKTRPWYVTRCAYCDGQAEDISAFTGLFQDTPERTLKGRYVTRSLLSSSQISSVYLAVTRDGPTQQYAIKEISTITLFRADERREAEATLYATLKRWQELNHENLPHIREVFRDKDKFYIVSEFIEGWSGKRIIAESLEVTPMLASNWGYQLCQLLSYLYEQEPSLHVPFLAPQHIIIGTDGVLKLLDWGVTAIFAPATYGPYGSIRGYAAPELQINFPTAESDIFAVARLLYALLIGQSLEKGVRQPAPLQRAIPSIPPDLVKVVAQAAGRDPGTRPSVDDFMHILRQNADMTHPITAWRSRRSEPPTPGHRSRRAAPASRTTSTPVSMSDMGFEQDSRFGPREAPAGEIANAVKATKEIASPRLAVHPHSFDLANLKPDTAKRLVLNLHNAGETELVGRVASHVGWLKAPRQSFHLPADKRAKVILTVQTADLPVGRIIEPQAISVETNGGHQWVAIQAEIASQPLLSIEQPFLDFGVFEEDSERAARLTVSNTGRQTLTGKVTSRIPWLQVSQSDFRCPGGGSTQVSVRLIPSRLPRGGQSIPDALVIDSDGGQARVQVTAWRVTPELGMSSSRIDLGVLRSGDIADQDIQLGNVGDGPLKATIQSLVPWMSIEPSQLSLAPGQDAPVRVRADTTGLPDGVMDIFQAARVFSNGGNATLSLRLRVQAPHMVVEDISLNLGAVLLGEQATGTVRIHNTGSATLHATVEPLVDWLVPLQQELTCEPNSEFILLVQANTSKIGHGQVLEAAQALRISDDTNVIYVQAKLVILHPALRVEPEEIDFGYLDPTQPGHTTVKIINDGTGNLAWNAQTTSIWLEFTPQAGVCTPGKNQDIQMTAYALALDEQEEVNRATLIINSDGGRAKVGLQAGMAAPQLAIDTSLLLLGPSINYKPVSGNFRIFNRGLGTLKGSIIADQAWIVPSRASFECPMGRSAEIEVTVDMEEILRATSHHTGTVRIESNGGTHEIIIECDIILAPELEASTEGIVLSHLNSEEPIQAYLSIRNTGQVTAHAELQGSVPQLAFSRNFCAVKPGKSVRIIVRWQGPLPDKAENVIISILSEDGFGATKEIRVPVSLSANP